MFCPKLFFLLGILYIANVVQIKRGSIPPCSAQGYNTNVRNTDAFRGTVANITTCAPEISLFLCIRFGIDPVTLPLCTQSSFWKSGSLASSDLYA